MWEEGLTYLLLVKDTGPFKISKEERSHFSHTELHECPDLLFLVSSHFYRNDPRYDLGWKLLLSSFFVSRREEGREKRR